MVQFWKLTQTILSKPNNLRNLFFAGGSIATLGLLSTPTRRLMDNMNAITPIKVNITLGIGLLLLVSNTYFAYFYFQGEPGEDSDQPLQP